MLTGDVRRDLERGRTLYGRDIPLREPSAGVVHTLERSLRIPRGSGWGGVHPMLASCSVSKHRPPWLDSRQSSRKAAAWLTVLDFVVCPLAWINDELVITTVLTPETERKVYLFQRQQDRKRQRVGAR